MSWVKLKWDLMQICAAHTDQKITHLDHHSLERFPLQSDGGLEHQTSSWSSALFTWSSSKTFDRHARRVLRSSPHGHPADVPWRSCLARLHHRPYGNQGDSGVAWLLGAGRLPWWTDLDCVHVGLPWLTGTVWLPGAGRWWWDDERDVDLLDSASGRIGHRSRSLWSQGHSLESKRKRQTVPRL